MATSTPSAPNERTTVLVVDDVPDNITILASALSEQYRVKAATSGERALRVCRSDDPPSLVLLDVVMPIMDGYEVCRQLKADPKTADIAVIFVSGLSDPADEEAGLAAGASDYLTKPVSAPLVLHRVRAHLEFAEARRMLQAFKGDVATTRLPHVGTTSSPGGLRGDVANRRCNATVFCSEIDNLTPQTDGMGPERIGRLLTTYFGRMSEIIARHGGTLDTYLGCAVVVLFGVPHSRGAEADALACVALALALQELLESSPADWRDCGIAEPLQVRMGAATGVCTVGSFGSGSGIGRRTFGSTVDLAVRLPPHARSGTLLVCEETRRLLGDHVVAVPQPAFAVQGCASPVVTYEVRFPT